MADYSISLGALISPEGLQRVKGQIETLEANPITLQIDSSLVDSKVKGLRGELKALGTELKTLGGKGALKFDTSTLEASLNRVVADIGEIKTAFSTLDSKAGMGNLLTSINQISAALDNASKQFVELNTQLNSLAGKNFGVNIGINMGSSAGGRNGAYGSLARGSTIPQLEQQRIALENYLKQYYKVADGINAVQKLIQGTGVVTSLNHPMALLPRMGDDSNLDRQMTAYRQYIALIKEAAALKGVDLTPVTSTFTQSADQLVTKAQNVRNGTDQLENSLQKLKGVFGSGVDAERLSTQLDSIVADLNEIKVAIQGLSSGSSLEGLTQSFNSLSASIEKLVGSATQAKTVLADGLNTSATSAGTQRTIQEQNQLAQTTSQTANTVAQSGQKVQQAFAQMASASNLDPVNLKDDVAETDEFSAAIIRLKQLISGIGKIQVGQINTSTGVQELQLLENKLNSLSAEWNETVAIINQNGGMGLPQMQQLRGQMETTTTTLDRLKAKVTDVKAQMAGNITGNFGNYDVQLTTLENKFNNLATKPPELQAKLESLKQTLASLKTADGTEEIIAKNKEYLTMLSQVKAALLQLGVAEKGSFGDESFAVKKEAAMLRLTGLFERGSQASRVYSGEVAKLRAELNACGNSSGVDIVNGKISNLAARIKQANVETVTFGTRFKQQLSQYSTYFSGYMLFSYAIQGLRSMFEQVKSIDAAMIELKKVTEETDNAYNKFLTNAADRAKAIGTTIDGLVSSTADFARLGYSFEDAQGLAEVANIYAVVGDEIDGVEQATESLISTMAAFKDSAGDMSNSDFAMSIVDKFNEVGKLIA